MGSFRNRPSFLIAGQGQVEMAIGGRGTVSTADIPIEVSRGNPALELHSSRPARLLDSFRNQRSFLFAGQVFRLLQCLRNQIHYSSVGTNVIHSAVQGFRLLYRRRNRVHYSGVSGLFQGLGQT